jgi:hypothetical protein
MTCINLKLIDLYAKPEIEVFMVKEYARYINNKEEIKRQLRIWDE